MSAAEEAEARTLILALLHRYASLAREHFDASQIDSLFHPGALIHFLDGRKLKPEQLSEITRSDPPMLLRHHLTTIDIQFVARDVAHCQSFATTGTHVKMPDHWARWDDKVRRQSNGRWKFDEKIIVLEGLDPEGWLAGTRIKS